MQRGTRSALSRSVPVQRGTRSAFSRSVPMQRGARFVFREMHAIDSRRGSKGLMGQRSHAAWRSFFSNKNVPMQRGTQSARCHFGARALPCYVFHRLGLRGFGRVARLALSRFVFR